MKSVLTTVSAFLLPLCAFGQGSILENYVKEGLQANLGIIKEQLQLERQNLNVAEAKAQYLPTVAFEASYLLAQGGRKIEIPVGSLVNPIYGALNEITGTNNFPVDLADVSEQLAPNNFHETKIRVIQPLFNTSIYYNHKAQEGLVSVQQAKINAYQLELAKEIKVGYFNYLKTLEVLKVLDNTEETLQEVLRFNRKLVQYDKATADAVASVEFELSRLQSERAGMRQQSEVAKAFFNSLLNRDLTTEVEVDQSLPVRSDVAELPDQLKVQALQRRPELLQLQEAIKTNQIVTELNRRSKLPTVGLDLSTGYQGFGYKFNSDQYLTTLGVGLTWTLYSGKQRDIRVQQSEVETLKLEKDRAMVRQQIELQITQAWHALQAAGEQLRAEQSARRSARTSFDIIRSKYENEQALLVEYLDARAKMTNAGIAVAIAEYDQLIRRAELDQAIGL